METLEIHSKSFLIKWVYVPTGGTLVWQVKPTKKSINFGVFRHPKDEHMVENLDPVIQRPPSTSVGTSAGSNRSEEVLPIDAKMVSNGLEKILWHGRCISNELLRGHFDVQNEHGGMFAMVFDNTFSKTTAKTVLFSYHVKKPQSQLSTPPLSGKSGDISFSNGSPSHLNVDETAPADSRAVSGSTTPAYSRESSAIDISQKQQANSGGLGSGNNVDTETRDSDISPSKVATSLPQRPSFTNSASALQSAQSVSQLAPPPPSGFASGSGSSSLPSGSVVSTESVQQRGGRSQNNQFPSCVSDGRYISGVMLKKRRKKLQGFARRYFRLDYKYGVLNYYFKRHSSVLRGSMPIRLSVVSANASTRSIIIDSGAEIWSLKALSDPDWKTWVSALDVAKHSTAAPQIAPNQTKGVVSIMSVNQEIGKGEDGNPTKSKPLSDYKFASSSNDTVIASKLDELRGIIAQLDKTNASLKAAMNGTPFQILENNVSQLSLAGSSKEETPVSAELTTRPRRASLWRMGSRRNSRPDGSGEPITLDRRSSVSSLRKASPELRESGISKDHVRDATESLDNIIAQFSSFVGTIQDMQTAKPSPDNDRASVFSDDMFYDAEENDDGVIYLDAGSIERSGESQDPLMEEGEPREEQEEDSDVSSSSDDDNDDRDVSVDAENLRISFLGDKSLQIGDDLYPLPLSDSIRRRADVTPCNSVPPSLMGFLRKNVGKDLTSITMPVTSNEPLTIIQRYSEQFEYSNLLTEAATVQDPHLRMLLVASFAVSTISNQRAKERSLRKPFNPLLGETFELIREDLGFRLIGEKVSHRPPIIAFQIDSAEWTAHFSGRPGQKFWGKSMEITDEGAIRITFRKSGEVYEFLPPPSFIRNLIAGERYVEPVGKVTVISSNGFYADIDYHKAKGSGLFGGGRTEDVIIKVFDESKRSAPEHAVGKWTEGLNLLGADGKIVKPLWRPGNLVANSSKKYGFTEFAASLNEITDLERDAICHTDSRLRPDQRHYENGNTDEAEKLKLDLEEQQRQRRKVMEEAGETWEPSFFEKASHDTDDQHYVIKTGDANYWNRRRNGDWSGISELW